jgi:hypothetical protein
MVFLRILAFLQKIMVRFLKIKFSKKFQRTKRNDNQGYFVKS